MFQSSELVRHLASGLLVGFVAAHTAPLLAQERETAPLTSSMLEDAVSPGDTIFVTDRQGRELEGKLDRLTPTALVMLVGDRARDIPFADTERIEKRGDSLKNGLIAGAAIGLGAGYFRWAILPGREGPDETGCYLRSYSRNGINRCLLWEGGPYSKSYLLRLMAVNGSAFAAVGALIDWSWSGRSLVYRSSDSAKLSLTPIISPSHRMLTVTLAF